MAARESIANLKKRAGRVAGMLAKLYPEARITLDFETPWQCLAATILSAQSTDVGVNRVTPGLFREYPDARAMAAADRRRVEELIHKTGFFRQKTRSLIGAARKIVEDYGGEVPSEMEALVKIPGVGRKTANVILGHIHGKPGFVVDTHVRRLTYRMGFTRRTDPAKIEIDMQKILPAGDWTMFSMRLIIHGRQLCSARKPACEVCALAADCPKIGVRTAPRG
ncbi:MAG: endonuclease III [Candidatus Binatus sp.]|uniref:endonuclease III n=1 Tax=Candidatus Binatus sp. TaxID=2811406 RepID=UPI003D104B1A